MKQVSVQDLKARLSAVLAEVEAGATVVVTRHKAAVALLHPVRAHEEHRGGRVGARLTPALKRGTKGRYLVVLQEDRGNR